jgi:hypothetical protein
VGIAHPPPVPLQGSFGPSARARTSLPSKKEVAMQPHSLIPVRLLGSLIDLNHPGHYLHWGFIQLSVANAVVIGLMVVVFAAAVLIPFRRHGGKG